MAESSDHLTHPVLGTLAWDPARSYWSARHPLASGGAVDVIVEPGAGDRHEFLPRAAELFRWAVDNERAVLSEAVRVYLLDLYNGTWRQDGEPALDAAGFVARLEWQVLTISASEVAPVEFGYDPGELFGGHSVWVQVDARLRFRRTHLIG